MQVSAEQTWGATQEHLRSLLSTDIYSLWFAPLRARAQEDHSLVLEVADDFCGIWLKENYVGLLEDAVAKVSGRRLKIQFEVRSGGVGTPPEDHDLGSTRSKVANGALERKPAAQELGLGPQYNFDTFVVGNNNNFAHAAALAVAQEPGKTYNPLFLHGGVGLGKTHLLHAIGHHVVTHRKGARVAYLSSERFTNEYIEGIQNNQLQRFRKRFRQADVLLIDDVQFLAGKERIQEEFFHTFNTLHEASKQIVMRCDRPASEIQNLQQRLVSRFEWGLVTDLQPPDMEMRLAILRRKAQDMGVELPEEIMSFLANRVRSNIRRLEGALIRVTSYAAMTAEALSVGAVEGLLRDILHQEGPYSISIEAIQKQVAEHYNLGQNDLRSRRRPENIAFPRQVAMFLSRQMTEISIDAIGEAFGGRNHGTVMYACESVKDRMETDPQVREVVNSLEMRLSR